MNYNYLKCVLFMLLNIVHNYCKYSTLRNKTLTKTAFITYTIIKLPNIYFTIKNTYFRIYLMYIL